ncbi:Mechanosensitive ion channel [Verrucomicrobium sp. GAS474]|uniref:mechanosensitive ion channel family protein n=1 Tax=Verrucomicrobium sp. GAS474 TaxID=1882831 RepID=UPI000879914A|nr:mechanosensitive ion channel domain-containing protein [Verrucomicrobium sp. GAS474]SDT96543.1 Mechanosensitive ion channel [Verrucomicrobium sp. GAS474]
MSSLHLSSVVECATALVAALLFGLLWRSVRRRGPQPAGASRYQAAAATLTRLSLRRDLLRAAAPPLQFCAWYFCLYFALPLFVHVLKHPGFAAALEQARLPFWHLGLLGGLFWFLYRCVDAVETRLAAIAAATSSRFDEHLFPVLALALRVFIPIGGFASLLETLHYSLSLGTDALHAIWRGFAIVVIVGLAAVSHALLQGIEKAILAGLDLDPDLTGTDSRSMEKLGDDRATATRIGILRKCAIVLNILIALAAILMLFPEARQIGTSLLASAGIVGILIGFAAQRTLGTLFAGIQLALSQPVRLGDSVAVEGESGVIEAITLTHVTIRTGDGRGRLILPISSFLERPFRNLTSTTPSVVQQVKIRVDFTLPVAALRDETRQWIATHRLWDRETFSLTVTDADAGSMELRLLASAATLADSSVLQLEAREWLLAQVVARYPECLPKVRDRTETSGKG